MRSIELFTGAGGLALGLSLAGFKHELLVEADAQACATIRANKERGISHVKDWPLRETDVRTIEYDAFLPDVDVLAAGVPCQPFSHGGKKLGDYDERNMFPEVTRAARALRPKAILIENVRGLLNANFQAYFEYLKLKLSFPGMEKQEGEAWQEHLKRLRRTAERPEEQALAYDVFSYAVNAADYGVPQWRERAIIVALRRDLDLTWTMPAPTHSMDALLRAKWKTGSYWDSHGEPRRTKGKMSRRFAIRWHRIREVESELDERLPWRTVRDALTDLPRLHQGQVADQDPDHYLNPGARSYEKHVGSLLDEPAKTLKAGTHGVPGGENTLALGGSKVRYFSIRECARLQTFPDEFTFATANWTRGMRQVGNAVPVKLAEVVGHSIRQTLTKRSVPVAPMAGITK